VVVSASSELLCAARAARDAHPDDLHESVLHAAVKLADELVAARVEAERYEDLAGHYQSVARVASAVVDAAERLIEVFASNHADGWDQTHALADLRSALRESGNL
jgi:hypothetical protein